jgi:hypothetical protein
MTDDELERWLRTRWAGIRAEYRALWPIPTVVPAYPDPTPSPRMMTPADWRPDPGQPDPARRAQIAGERATLTEVNDS